MEVGGEVLTGSQPQHHNLTGNPAEMEIWGIEDDCKTDTEQDSAAKHKCGVLHRGKVLL